MQTLATTALVALAVSTFGITGHAAADPAHETVIVAHFNDGDSHGHNSTNDDEDDEIDDPVTGRGPNKGTKTLKDTLGVLEDAN